MRITKFAVTATFTLILIASIEPILAQYNWEVATTFPIGGQGAWDYLTVDSQTHRLFVPRSTHTMVIDAESGKVLGDIPGQKIAHGVALVPRLGRGFISDGGGDGGIVVFDLKSYAVLGTIAAKHDADGIIYDSSIDRVLVAEKDGAQPLPTLLLCGQRLLVRARAVAHGAPVQNRRPCLGDEIGQLRKFPVVTGRRWQTAGVRDRETRPTPDYRSRCAKPETTGRKPGAQPIPSGPRPRNVAC
jgi:hypothetical protein